MKRLLLSTLFVVAFSGGLGAQVTNGRTYRIALADNDNKSAFVKNSSPGNAAVIVIWTETNVPAQQWQAQQNDDGTVSFCNVYTGKWLAVSGTARDKANACQMTSTGATSRWTLTPTGEADTYQLSLTSTNGTFLLACPQTKDGSNLVLRPVTADTVKAQTTWKLVETTPVTSLDDTARLRMMNGWLDRFLQDRGTDQQQIGSQDGWQLAEMLEVVLDAYETTANPRYSTLFTKLFNFVNAHLGSNYCQLIYTDAFHWYGHEFNDDVMWLILASIRGYLLTGNTTCLQYARQNFETVWQRGYNKGGWGMMQWKSVEENANGTNSCIDGPTAVAACYLGMATGQEQYFTRARGLYAQQRRYLANIKTGHVFDSFTWDTSTLQPSSVNKWASTYNQGTMLGAAVMLYDHYHDPMYKTDAEAIMDYTVKNLCDGNGIVSVCQTQDSDYPSFKGILMRYVRKFIMHMQEEGYVDWIGGNALRAYSNMNSQSIASTAWLTKSAEDFSYGNQSFANAPHSCATAVSAAYNTPRHAVVRSAYDTILADHMDTHRGLSAVESTAGTGHKELSDIKTGYYAVYENIDFGHRAASSMEIRVSQAAASGYSVMATLDSLNGAVMARFSIPTTGGWQTLKADISPLEGLHNIYLRFYATSQETDAYRVAFFRFTSENEPLGSDVTDNGGSIVADVEVENIGNLVDNHPTSYVTVNRPQADFTYTSPVDVRLRGYTLTSPSLASRKTDPKDWTLLASADGSTWVTLDEQSEQAFATACQTKKYAVATDKSYRLFRLHVTANQGASSLSLGEWQLHGACLFPDDITTDGGRLTTGESTAIDKDTATVATSSDASALTLTYHAAGTYTPTAYSLTSAASTPGLDPTAWTFYGSKDNRTWVVLDSQSGQTAPFDGITRWQPVSTETAYTYFRLVATAPANGERVALAELQIFGELASTASLYNDITKNMGTLRSSADWSEDALGALTDNDMSTAVTLPLTGGEAWISYQSDIPVQLKSYTVGAGPDTGSNPKTWTLEASDDGATWTALNTTTATLSTRSAARTVTVTASDKYHYFRLRVTATGNATSGQVNIGEWQLNGLAIASNSLTDQSGAISAEFPVMTGNSGENYTMAFDHSESTKYCLNYYATAWLQYAADSPFRANMYSITSANDLPGRDPYRWQLLASNDSVNWDVLDERRQQTFAARQVTQFYTCQRQGDYRYYRLQLLENNGDDLAQFAEWQLFYSNRQATGIDTPVHEGGASVSVWPNPVTDYLHVSSNGAGRVDIYNMRGQVMGSRRINVGETPLPFSGYASGMYLIKVTTREGIVTKKILK